MIFIPFLPSIGVVIASLRHAEWAAEEADCTDSRETLFLKCSWVMWMWRTISLQHLWTSSSPELDPHTANRPSLSVASKLTLPFQTSLNLLRVLSAKVRWSLLIAAAVQWTLFFPFSNVRTGKGCRQIRSPPASFPLSHTTVTHLCGQLASPPMAICKKDIR